MSRSQFVTWFFVYLKKLVNLLFSLVSPDGFSFGYMILGIGVVGAVVSATVGMVAIVSNAMARRGGRD